MKEVLGPVGCHLAVLSGPNHAEEIGRNLPAASVLSTEDLEVALHFKKHYVVKVLEFMPILIS